MNGLKLESAVEEVQPLRTIDIHGCAKHLLRERLIWSKIGGGHREMGDCELNVERHVYHVAYHHEAESCPWCRDRLVDDEVAEPVPEYEIPSDFEIAMPPG